MIKIVFMGTPDFAVPILETLIKKEEVVLVVTQPDKYVGRKKVLTPSPVKNKALENNIPVFQPLKIREDYELIKKYQPDLIVTCAYGQIIPKELLELPPLGCINVHASLLPKYRGGAPIQYALKNGDSKTGITIMYMDEHMDTGDIIKMDSIPILDTDNLATLSAKLSILGANLLEEVLPSIKSKTNERIKQDDNLATYAYTIKREEEHLDFNNLALDIYNKVRAFNPAPLANAIINGEEVKIIEGYVGEERKGLIGSICNIKKDEFGIQCLDKVFYVTRLKPFGKKEMLVKDYLNGIKKENLLNSIVK